MEALKCPCKDCPDRFVGCHCDCPKYKEFKENSAELKRRRVEERSYYFWKDVHIQNNIKQRKSSKLKR